MGIFRWLLRSIFLSMIRPPQNDLSHTSRNGDDSPSFVGKSFFPDNHDRLCIPSDDVRKIMRRGRSSAPIFYFV